MEDANLKNRPKGWLCGLLSGEREYIVNGVTYNVSARFESSESANSIRFCFERAITNETVDLTADLPTGIMSQEYVCSAVEEED